MLQPGGSLRALIGAVTLALAATTFPAPAAAAAPDLDGNGTIDAADEDALRARYGATAGDALYDAAADADGNGVIDFRDVAELGSGFGQSVPPDTTPPSLLVTLNDIPDDMNDLLVAPPDGIHIALHFDTSGGSLLDPATLQVTSSQDIGALAAGTDLAPQFTVTPTRAVWEIPPGTDLARTSHYLNVSIRDVAGNEATAVYGFAVRDFNAGAPLGALQTIVLDFDRDRSLGPEIDFLEDLRDYGLSSSAAPAYETQMRDRVVTEILERTRQYYGRLPDGSPGPDPVNIAFVDTPPAPPFSTLCVGGASAQGASYLGGSTMDLDNAIKSSNECDGPTATFGVFPQAIEALWGQNTWYLAQLGPLDPDLGGVPVGEDPRDAVVLDPGFDPEAATAEELERWSQIDTGVAAFSQTLATAIAHETGHLLGLVAHGPAPGGLFGGSSGANTDHNVKATGGAPTDNWIMNAGATFSFEEVSGAGGTALPAFRPLSWAYLRDRIVRNTHVTALFDAPEIFSVTPNPVSGSATITVHGANFLATPQIELLIEGDPTPNEVLEEVWVDSGTVTGLLFPLLTPPGVYDVRLINPDDQVVVLIDGLEVQ